jgi:hypothetical protein
MFTGGAAAQIDPRMEIEITCRFRRFFRRGFSRSMCFHEVSNPSLAIRLESMQGMRDAIGDAVHRSLYLPTKYILDSVVWA